MTTNNPFWPSIKSADKAGITAVDMLGIVFFLDPAACADSSYAIRAFETYLKGIGQHQALAYLDNEGDMQPMPADPRPVLENQLLKPFPVGEEEGDDDAIVRMFLVDPGKPAFRYHARYFYVFTNEPTERLKKEKRIPILFRISQQTFAAIGPEAVIAFALELSEFLPYSSGYISPMLTCEDSFETALPYANRYPGLDVAQVDSVGIDIGDHPPGAYWVNLFGPRLSQSLGGPDALRSALPPEVRIRPCGQGGFCTVLGDVPDVGDVNRQNRLPFYRQLATVLRPQLHVSRVTYFTDEDGLADRDAQTAWHERFLR